MENKNALNDKELQQVNGARGISRDITKYYIVTCEDNSEVVYPIYTNYK